MIEKAVVIFSGGQDSTSILGYALKKFDVVTTITFDYGQKHKIEVEQSKKICEKYNVRQIIIDISFLDRLVDSALTSGGDVTQQHSRLKNLPASFVPNRNALFITLAHAYAQKIGAETLVGGMCETDFSGYPDCRLSFIQSIEYALNEGSESCITIETPLMNLDKAEIFVFAEKYEILDDVLELSHTCYNGDREHQHDWGYGCNNCPACKLRREGWEKYQKIKNS